MCAAAAALGTAAPGSAFVYWANAGTNTIGRANLDGSAAQPAFITTPAPGVQHIAVGPGYLYWEAGGRIVRATLDGSSIDTGFMPTVTDATGGLAIDGGKLLFADAQSGGSIGVANLDGSQINETLIPGAATDFFAGDASYVYWASGGAITQSELNDGTMVRTLIPSADTNDLFGIAVEGSHIYWLNNASGTEGAGSVGTATLNGAGPAISPNPNLITGANGPWGITADANYVYWTDSGSFGAAGGTTIGRAALDGSGATQSFIGGLDFPTGIAVDTGALPDNTAAPTIAGTTVVGQTLTAAPGGWTQAPTRFTYAWQRCDAAGNGCAAVGATGNTYPLTTADVGDTLRVVVTAANIYGFSGPVSSAATAVVQPPPPTVATADATAITTSTAVLNGSVDPHGGTDAASFVYSTNPGLAGAHQTSPQVVPTGLGAVAVSAPLSGLRPNTRYYFRVEATDAALSTTVSGAITSFRTSVPLRRINAVMTWTFALRHGRWVVRQLQVMRAPRGSSIEVICRGKGCPHRATLHVRPHHGSAGTVNLVKLFAHRKIARGASLTVEIVGTGYIGKVYVFHFTGGVQPRIGCLSPGGSTPNVGC